MHWADVVAKRLRESGNVHRIATGITPSGHIHVGNMREILTGDMVQKAALDSGLDAVLYYLADDFDPLRKVYPFLPGSFSEHVGKPLSEIPAPEGSGTYSEYYLGPFLDSVRKLGIEPVVFRSSESYREGRYAEAVSILLDKRDMVKEILTRISRRDLPDEWIPYNARCGSCGRIDSTRSLSWESPFVSYSCRCGHQGKADTRTDDGKLPWRLDWPARWYWLGVTCEPFGKDHAASGGSYDTSSAIIREVLGSEPPIPVIYEWIQLKGKGAMSSSSGVVVSAVDMLKMAPPEVLRFLIARNQPNKHINMDPGLGILNLVDDYDRHEMEFWKAGGGGSDPEDNLRIYQLSSTEKEIYMPENLIQIPYRHLVTLVQLVEDLDSLLEKIRRTEGIDDFDEHTLRHIVERSDCVRYWLDKYAPEGVKFTLYDLPPREEIEKLGSPEIEALKAMREEFSTIDWNPEAIHNAVYDGSRTRGIEPKTTFTALYRILMGSERGPRLGFFLSTMLREDVIRMIDHALS
ncbi:MAG: lysine--tRNA ligase [Thermoplasmatota archaeon]